MGDGPGLDEGRRAAIALAVVSAAATVVVWWVGWWSTPSDVRLDGAPPTAVAFLAPLAMAAVVLAAAWLLARRRVLEGAVGLWSVALLTLPALITLPRELARSRGTYLGLGLLATLGLLAVVGAALLLRDHFDRGELEGPRVRAWVLVAGLVVVAGVVLPATVAHPPGMPSSSADAAWRPVILTTAGPMTVVFVLAPLTLLAVLGAASRLRRRYAAVAIVAAVLPLVAGQVGTLWLALSQPHLTPTPVAWLALAAQLVLLAGAFRWLTAPAEGGPRPEEPARAGAQPG